MAIGMAPWPFMVPAMVPANSEMPGATEYQVGYAQGYREGYRDAFDAFTGANPYQSGIVGRQSGAQNRGVIPTDGRAIGDTLPELDLEPETVPLVDPARILDLD